MKISNVTSLPIFTVNSMIIEDHQTGSVMKRILCIVCIHTEEYICVYACIHTYVYGNTPIMCCECLTF